MTIPDKLYYFVPSRALRNVLRHGVMLEKGHVLYQQMPPQRAGMSRIIIFCHNDDIPGSQFPLETILQMQTSGVWEIQETAYAFDHRKPFLIYDTMILDHHSFGDIYRVLPVRKVLIKNSYPLLVWRTAEHYYRLDDLTFYQNPFLEEVTIEEKITYIGCDSFSQCPALREVNLHFDDLNHLYANRVLCNCPNLETVRMPYALYQEVANKEQPWFLNTPKLTSVIDIHTNEIFPVHQ